MKKSTLAFQKTIYLIFAFGLMLTYSSVKADEGMWLPNLLKELNESAMQKIGCKLSAEQIYSVNHSSLKDAIVQFGGGCTGELVSNDGLLLTNHHCGYPSIQMHSTVENNYLENGFWAKNREAEIPTPGLTCTFVIRIEDVTKLVLKNIAAKMPEKDRQEIVNKNCKAIEDSAIKGTTYEAKIKSYFYGNEYYMVVTQTYKDVRLVGAPPEAIGKFGGEKDNWMWPRHTGDFSVFRIYANEKNEPAEYSANNKPYHPKHFLTISLKGYKQGDFTMTYGFPGRTFEYMTSHAIRLITENSNPTAIALREKCLNTWMNDMKDSPKIKIQYASKYARVANYYKKFQGEDKGMRDLHTIEMKEKQEEEFQKWVVANHKSEYDSLLFQFKNAYQGLTPLQQELDLYGECGMRIEVVNFARKFSKLIGLCHADSINNTLVKNELASLTKDSKTFYKDYNAPTDRNLMGILLKEYAERTKSLKPTIFEKISKDFNNDFTAYATDLFSKSTLVNGEKLTALLNNFKPEDAKTIEADPAYALMVNLQSNFNKNILPSYDNIQNQLDLLYRQWVKGLREMQPKRKFWPDANSTLRVAYGTVEPYKPYDGAMFDYKTTLSGVIEKMDNTTTYYKVPAKLVELYQKKDFGQYAENGDVPVAFIATNHTTGGNSGSPLLDKKGRLLGLNFDTSWEGTMSNYHFANDRVRNISVDIRYVLFIMDKYAGAGYLLSEMNLYK